MKRKVSILNVSALLSIGLLLVSLLYNQFLPSLIRWPLFLLVLAYLVILVNKKLPKALIIGISIALFLTSSLLIYSQYSADRLFEFIDKELNTISFVVLKDHPAKSMSDVKGSSFVHSGFFDADMIRFINEDIQSRFEFKPKLVSVASDIDAYNRLLEKEAEVFMLDNAFWDMIVDHDPKFESKVRVLYTVDKETDKEDIVKEVEVDKDSFIVLVSGNDNSGSLYNRARSDVNMLLVVNPNQGKIMMISLPRDSFVPLSCKNNALDKLTHAGIYGVSCTVKTVENLLGIDINYYVRLNFTAFMKIIDVVGDITVNNPREFTSWLGTYFPKGTLKLDSKLALQFARERKSFTNGDVDRTLNQQEVIRAIIKKMATPSSVLKVEQIIKSISKSFDTNASSDVISTLVKLQLEKNPDWKMSSLTITGNFDTAETFSIPGAMLNVYRLDPAMVSQAKQKITEFMSVSE